jgi:2'-5' RNA ligase
LGKFQCINLYPWLKVENLFSFSDKAFEIVVFLWLSDEEEKLYWEIKNNFKDTFGEQHYTKSRPHISLLTWHVPSDRVEVCCNQLYNSLKKCKTVHFSTKEFTTFKSKSTLTLVSLLDKSATFNDVLDAMILLKSELAGTKKLQIIKTPHITIGQLSEDSNKNNLKLEIFQKQKLKLKNLIIPEFEIRVKDTSTLSWISICSGKFKE